MTATIDDVANTLGEFEALAQSTGQWDGADPVEFSPDGVAWSTVWRSDEPPAFAKATVYRQDVRRPTVILVAWDESLPAVDEWRELWLRKPMKLFGSFALRSAIRHAFRDVVGDLRGPDEDAAGPQVRNDHAIADRTDWDTQLATAPDVEALDLVWKDMRTAHARTGAREVAYKTRRDELAAAAWEPAELARLADVTEERAAEVLRFAAEVGPVVDEAIAEAAAEEQVQYDNGEWSREVDVHPRRAGKAPQDFLPPANRAERRAAAKGKGRRK